MGFPTGDKEVEFGNDCLSGWAPGKTPASIGIRFTGIIQGALWIPADGDPPNVEVIIPQSLLINCMFQDFIDGKRYTFLVGAAQTFAQIFEVGLEVIFEATVPGNLETNIPSEKVVPAGNHFYGGVATISIIPGTIIKTIHGMMDLLNIEHSDETFVSSLDGGDDEITYRLGRGIDATNILIKTEE